MRRGLTSLLLLLLLLCVDKLTAYASLLLRRWCLCWFLFGFLFLCFFLWLFRFLCVCSLASVLCHCCWCCYFCCCWGYRDFLVVLLMVLWLLWYSLRPSYGVFDFFNWQLLTCMKLWQVVPLVFSMFSLTVAIVLELYDHTAPSPTQSTHVCVVVALLLLLLLLLLWYSCSRSSVVFCCFNWQLLLFLNCMVIQPPPPHRVRCFWLLLLLLLLLLLSLLLLSLLLLLFCRCSPPPPHRVRMLVFFCCCCSSCCCCCCGGGGGGGCFCDTLVVVLTVLLFYLTVAIVLELYACATAEATNAPQPDPSWLNNHLKLRQTRVDSSLWPRGAVPELPNWYKGLQNVHLPHPTYHLTVDFGCTYGSTPPTPPLILTSFARWNYA